MKRKGRILVGFGLFAAAIGLAQGARHCLRSMPQARSLKERVACCQEFAGRSCSPALSDPQAGSAAA